MAANWLLQAAGSPLLARQNPAFYFVIVAALAVILIFTMLWFFIRIIQKQKKSAAYLQKQQNAPTNRHHIEAAAKLCELTEDEANLLAAVCKKYNIPNIAYNYKNTEVVDSAFKRIFSDMEKQENNPATETRRSLLLSIRQKFEKTKTSQMTISSSKSIPEGTEMQYYDEAHKLFSAKVLRIDPDELVLSALQDNFGAEKQLSPLSKIQLFFQSKSTLAYLMTARIIRYQSGLNGTEILLSHTHDLQLLQHRDSKRVPIIMKCLFSAVKIEEVAKGSEKHLKYVPSGKNYGALLMDISAGGCKLECNVDVKEKQYIHLELQLEDGIQMLLIGLVVSTENSSGSNLRILHVRFVSLDQKTRNRILMAVYDYM